MSGRRGHDGGSIAVELAILAPLVGLLLACVFLVGRVQVARADVEGAARSAARELSIARDPQASIGDVEAALRTTLHVGSPTCRTMSLSPTISATEVSVSISCTVDLDSASLLPVPGSLTVTGSATEVIDRFRETGS